MVFAGTIKAVGLYGGFLVWKTVWKMFLKDVKSFRRKPLDIPWGIRYNSNPRPEDERLVKR